MSDIFLKLLRWFIIFSRNANGCLNSPYVTYRKLASTKADLGHTFYLFLLVVLYFSFASLVKTGVRNPFLLTYKFNILFFSALFGFILIILLIFLLGKLTGERVELLTIYKLWIYSLLPTLCWFFLTSILSIFLPPPRSLSLPGKIYSLVFMSFSLMVFFWKLILYYLTLRFGLRFGFFKIVFVSAAILPFFVLYSTIMYKLGIFRVPFI